MSELAPVLERCLACRSPFAEQINNRMVTGQPDTKVSLWLQENKAYISRITLGEHRRKHLTNEYQTAKAVVIKKYKKNLDRIKATGDLASLVRDQVSQMMEAGDLMPTLSEGLRAQEMMDRRVEKTADRELSITLASIIGGGPVVNMIEMKAEELESGIES